MAGKGLGDVFYVGKGNPFGKAMKAAADYDKIEAMLVVPYNCRQNPEVLGAYSAEARKSLDYLNAGETDNILEIGPGTGSATLEILRKNPDSNVFGIEKSPGMIKLSRYKFNQDEGKNFEELAPNKKVIDYWESFRKCSEPYKDRVIFIRGDIQTSNYLDDESMDCAFSNQCLHWPKDIPKAFGNINRMLRPEGELVWNTASHFCLDPEFPQEKYGIRYNDFLGVVMEEIGNNLQVGNYMEIAQPPHNIDSIMRLTAKEGFDTEHVSTYLFPYDFQFYLKNTLPALARGLIKSEITDDEKNIAIRDAIFNAMTTDRSFDDVRHKYEIIPIFRSTKLI